MRKDEVPLDPVLGPPPPAGPALNTAESPRDEDRESLGFASPRHFPFPARIHAQMAPAITPRADKPAVLIPNQSMPSLARTPYA